MTAANVWDVSTAVRSSSSENLRRVTGRPLTSAVRCVASASSLVAWRRSTEYVPPPALNPSARLTPNQDVEVAIASTSCSSVHERARGISSSYRTHVRFVLFGLMHTPALIVDLD